MQEIICGLESKRGTGYSQLKQIQDDLEQCEKKSILNENDLAREKLTGWDEKTEHLNLQNLTRSINLIN